MGSLYRSQHELLPLFKKGDASHVNNISLGKRGRHRTNVWSILCLLAWIGRPERSPGSSDCETDSNVAGCADRSNDAGEIVLDPFLGSGSTCNRDLRCLSCGGSGCNLCKYTGWLEVAGAGMIHPEVLKNGDIDPEVYSGYAWGLGVERLVMLKHGINDIRLFTENDQRFLEQFSV